MFRACLAAVARPTLPDSVQAGKTGDRFKPGDRDRFKPSFGQSLLPFSIPILSAVPRIYSSCLKSLIHLQPSIIVARIGV
jgi:hypothetical protein